MQEQKENTANALPTLNPNQQEKRITELTQRKEMGVVIEENSITFLLHIIDKKYSPPVMQQIFDRLRKKQLTVKSILTYSCGELGFKYCSLWDRELVYSRKEMENLRHNLREFLINYVQSNPANFLMAFDYYCHFLGVYDSDQLVKPLSKSQTEEFVQEVLKKKSAAKNEVYWHDVCIEKLKEHLQFLEQAKLKLQ